MLTDADGEAFDAPHTVKATAARRWGYGLGIRRAAHQP
jgi:hypothetical protein